MICPGCHCEIGGYRVCPHCGTTIYLEEASLKMENLRYGVGKAAPERNAGGNDGFVLRQIKKLKIKIDLILVLCCANFFLLLLLFLAVMSTK